MLPKEVLWCNFVSGDTGGVHEHVAINTLTHRLRGVHGSGCGCGLDPGGCGFIESDVQSAGIWLPLVATPEFPDLAGHYTIHITCS